MTRRFRITAVVTMAAAVGVTVDPEFCLVAAICVAGVGAVLEVALFGMEKA